MTTKIKSPGLFKLLLCSLALAGCAADELRAPSLDDNKSYSLCKQGLVEVYTTISTQKDNIPTQVKQRLISLVIAAEIDSQFKSYPYCVDKLERAKLFIKQAKIDIIVPVIPDY